MSAELVVGSTRCYGEDAWVREITVNGLLFLVPLDREDEARRLLGQCAAMGQPPHQHLRGAHLRQRVEGCLLCDAMTQRDELRAKVAALEAGRSGEAVCDVCGGHGTDPEPYIAARCCGNADERGDCCGNPSPSPEPQPCRQCGGAGKVAAAPQQPARDEEAAYLRWRLEEIMPLFEEARDALPAITEPMRKLRGIRVDLADRMDAAGTRTRDDFAALRKPAR